MSSSYSATFAEVRRNQIAALIQQRSRITVQELCSLFSVSSATIRNDLSELVLGTSETDAWRRDQPK